MATVQPKKMESSVGLLQVNGDENNGNRGYMRVILQEANFSDTFKVMSKHKQIRGSSCSSLGISLVRGILLN